MSKTSLLLSRVANIELYNLKNICPFFVQKKTTGQYEPIENMGIFDSYTKMNNTIDLKNVYFRSGNYVYVAFQPYLIQKYNVPLDNREHEENDENSIN